ncbi:hypothetical protein [Paenibacillus sp. Marseille-Q4541]|uniref:hypothetical protein n=1 Tax=Paenibacillus sp. Marseille-Q4541 TaxID=2831522 RepID=UPI001BAE2D6F|nr:hypothetical protein [Paenibacillus sp. Marseille-Q4541]
MIWFELQELHDFIPYLVSIGLIFAVTYVSLLHLSFELTKLGVQGEPVWPEYVPEPMRSVTELHVRSVILMLRRYKISPDDDSDDYHSSLLKNAKHNQRGGYIWDIQKDSFLFKNGRYGFMVY